MKNISIFLAIVLSTIEANAWSNQSTFKIETGADLQYVIAAPADPENILKKLPILIYEEGDGTSNIILNNTFGPIPMLENQLAQASQASGFIWAMPELRTQYFAGQALQICSLDFKHRERDLERFIDEMKKLPFVDSSRIFLMGHSAGGDTVTHVAANRSDVHGVINLAGGVGPSCSENSTGCPASLQSLIQYQCSANHDMGRTGDWWKQLFLESNLFKSISSLNLPYLALIGDQDTIVSVPEFRDYSAQTSKLKSNFQAGVLPGLDHESIVTAPQVMQMMIQFVNQNST